MTPHESMLQNLDDAAILRILSYATEQLAEKLPDTGPAAVQSEEEARQAVGEFLRQYGAGAPVSLAEGGNHGQQARALLELMLQDPETRPTVQELVDHPPQDSQRSIELALEGAVILGGLVMWLRTNVEIDIDRKGGKTAFHFRLRTKSASDSLIRTIAKSVAGLFPG